MKTVIVNSSKSPHQNTHRIAEEIGGVLDAELLTPEQATPALLGEADLIGFGSGIYLMNFDQRLKDCIRSLPNMAGHDAFVFATSGMPEPPFPHYTRRLGKLLNRQGFKVVDTFTCRGLDTWGPFGLIGGVSKGHPDDGDLAKARDFAARLLR
ncbi:flavodoxin family protein [Rhodococcus sp. G-MC3]|uniref:flavodoxin family protein n=1 Tax=Rhodococcus sp. G-MC3 TaxID=3046209 RepID=UPI0024BAD7BB|nr:flavodoxin family protein [Rhodococcus sp. G-MC3]MDJ0393639.1 flavodoxin family protein [Rhodococcus sp. G-MC3]